MDPRLWTAVTLAVVVGLGIGVLVDLRMFLTSSPTTASSTSAVVVATSTLPILTLDNTPSPIVASTTKNIPAPSKTLPKANTGNAAMAAPAAGAASPPPPQVTQGELDAAASLVRSALVNILCISQTNSIESISGSGILIAPQGLILTNAHIAQYFLLAHDPSLFVSCSIRTGSPARPTYRADLAFISPKWIERNADILSKTHPTGNGEHDFAFLGITGSATDDPLPSSFPSLSLATDNLYVAEPIVIGAYAAQFLSGDAVRSMLYPTIVFGSIKNIYTFETSTIDVASLGGSAVAQEGSSGGGVVNASGELIGTITTSTIEGDTSTRNLSAISAVYIRRAYLEEAGLSLDSLLDESLQNAIAAFAPQIPALTALITAALAH